MRDHGGDIGSAIARHGGAAADWIDLSTGINRLPYPIPPATAAALRALPTAEATAASAAAARAACGAPGSVACLPLAGAQAAIRLVPGLRSPGRVAVLAPTYNEHAAAFAAAGWTVTEVATVEALTGFDAAVAVNPNNPDGRRLAPEVLLALAGRVGLLVVDESFGDVDPSLSVCPDIGRRGLIVLRSFGKFHGLAGLRLGFALGAAEDLDLLAVAAGPWPVSGPALEAGTIALVDTDWAYATRRRLAAGARRLDRLAASNGWGLVGGTSLFRLYDTPDAVDARAHLAGARIWSRAFPWSRRWLRLGLPGPESEWTRLASALSGGATDTRP